MILNIWFSSLPFLIIVGAMATFFLSGVSPDHGASLCFGFFVGSVVANLSMLQFFDKGTTTSWINANAMRLHICHYALMFGVWVIGWRYFDWTWRSLVALIGTILIVQAIRLSTNKLVSSGYVN